MKNMKYKVLAADDEFWSRENIRNLIPWEEYSLEFLEPACDGEEVMDAPCPQRPFALWRRPGTRRRAMRRPSKAWRWA